MASFPEQYTPAPSEDYIGYELLGVGSAFIGIQTLFILLRLWARREQGPRLSWDDGFLYAGFLCSLVVDSLICAIVIDGKVGYHIAYLEATEPQIVPTYTKILFAVEGVYLAAELFTKLSILYLYLRFFRERSYRLATYFLISIIIATWFGETIAWILQCNPVSDFWEKTPEDGNCFNRQLFYGFLNVPNIITDVAAILLAGLMVRKLQMNMYQKIGCVLTFMTGLIGTAASLARCITFFTISPFTDATWNSTILLIWTVVEPATYVIVACLPSLRTLLRNKSGSTDASAGQGGSVHTVKRAPRSGQPGSIPLSSRLWKNGEQARGFQSLDTASVSGSLFAQSWRDTGGITITNDLKVEERRTGTASSSGRPSGYIVVPIE